MKMMAVLMLLLLTACANTHIEIRTIRSEDATNTVSSAVRTSPSPVQAPTAIPTALPSATDDISRIGSRSNPVPFGETAQVLISGYPVRFTISQAYFGDEAQERIKSPVQLNPGLELMLVYVDVEYPSTAKNAPSAVIHGTQFGLISDGEVFRGGMLGVGPQPELYFEI